MRASDAFRIGGSEHPNIVGREDGSLTWVSDGFPNPASYESQRGRPQGAEHADGIDGARLVDRSEVFDAAQSNREAFNGSLAHPV
jgi:hypothetical protein